MKGLSLVLLFSFFGILKANAVEYNPPCKVLMVTTVNALVPSSNYKHQAGNFMTFRKAAKVDKVKALTATANYKHQAGNFMTLRNAALVNTQFTSNPVNHNYKQPFNVACY